MFVLEVFAVNAIMTNPDESSLNREELREIIRLLNRYGIAKFGDEWEPCKANPWLTGGRRQAARRTARQVGPYRLTRDVHMTERSDAERCRKFEDSATAETRGIDQETRHTPTAAEMLAMEPAERAAWEKRIADALF